MSNLIHCDGPNCDKTKDINEPERLGRPGWLMLEQANGPTVDFHDRACLTAWSTGKPAEPTVDDRPCTCVRAQQWPHTKAEHQAYPTSTTVDGL